MIVLMEKSKFAIFSPLLAAALYAVGSPFAKLLLEELPPVMMAAFLYLGAGMGMAMVGFVRRHRRRPCTEQKLTRKELPFTLGMVVLDIAAPIFLMIGLTMTTAANASLLNNFEIAATALIAFAFFKESVGKRLWFAIGLITLSSVILSFEDMSSFSFSFGSLFVLLSCICWGLENNCTRVLSEKDPLQIVVVKGFGSGLGSLGIALVIGEHFHSLPYIIAALLLGFVSYGLSIFFYVHAQRRLGAAKTSTYYAIAPFIGVAFSLAIFRQFPTVNFLIALVIMALGTYFASANSKSTGDSITEESVKSSI